MQPHRIISALALAVTAAVFASGCGGSSSAKTPATTSSPSGGSAPSGASSSGASSSGSGVKIANFAFSPATLTVSGGAHVSVANDDSTAHTFTADDGHSFDTGSIDPGSTATVNAPKPGRYAYHCSIHPFMHGTLVVH